MQNEDYFNVWNSTNNCRGNSIKSTFILQIFQEVTIENYHNTLLIHPTGGCGSEPPGDSPPAIVGSIHIAKPVI